MAADVDILIDTTVRQALDPVPVASVAVEHRRDSGDEDALYVLVTLPADTPLVGGQRYIGAMTAVSNALMAVGDRRFPYIRLNRLGEEAAEESDRSEAQPR